MDPTTSPILTQREDSIFLPDFRHQLDPTLDPDLHHDLDQTFLNFGLELYQLDPTLRQPVDPIFNPDPGDSPQDTTAEASSRLTNQRASFSFYFKSFYG